MTRLVDRGAITAAYVGIGMAVTIVASFTLIIPIESFIWLMALPAGLLIGYYANQRSNRRAGPWARIIANGFFAAILTGVSMAALLLLIKVIFFFADTGYPGYNRVDEEGNPIPPFCDVGAGCVYQRYLDADHGTQLAAIGVTDATSFTAYYWGEQLGVAGTIVAVAAIGGLGGAGLYGVFRPKAPAAGSLVTAP